MGDYAGAWLRVSSGGQDEASQEPDVLGWIGEHGYELARTWRLHGRSASKGEQQAALDEVIADMRAGLISVLVVWAADRIERRGALSHLILAEQVRQAGGRIEYVKDGHLNEVNDMSDVMLALAATMARQETARKRERIAMARSRSRANGALTGRAAWGYAVEGERFAKRLVPTEEGRRLVPGVFERCIAGESLAAIAQWLAAETGREWWPHTVGLMIRNPVYRGAQHDAAGRVIHRCEPLVDAAAWKRAGEALDGRPKRGATNPATRAMLATALFCPACENSPMYRIAAGTGASRTFYYRCAGRGADRKGCGNMARLDAVDAAVNRIIARYFDTPVTVRTLIPGNRADLDARLEEIRFEIAQLGQLDLPDDEYDARLAELRAERDRVKNTRVVPDRVEERPTGERYAALWQRTPVPARGPWLRQHEFKVYADKTMAAVEQGRKRAEEPLDR